tara:strand:- start:1245 stop:1901 length:657 start_codon:yes stop_codon:yes gene_type:complete
VSLNAATFNDLDSSVSNMTFKARNVARDSLLPPFQSSTNKSTTAVSNAQAIEGGVMTTLKKKVESFFTPKTILIIVVVVVAAVAGGYFYYQYRKKQNDIKNKLINQEQHLFQQAVDRATKKTLERKTINLTSQTQTDLAADIENQLDAQQKPKQSNKTTATSTDPEVDKQDSHNTSSVITTTNNTQKTSHGERPTKLQSITSSSQQKDDNFTAIEDIV